MNGVYNGEPRAEGIPFPAWAIRDADALISARVTFRQQAREEFRVVPSGAQPEGRSSFAEERGGLRRLLEALAARVNAPESPRACRDRPPPTHDGAPRNKSPRDEGARRAFVPVGRIQNENTKMRANRTPSLPLF